MSIIRNVARKLTTSAKEVVDALHVSEEELQQELQEYEEHIVPRFTYFNELDEAGQERFLQRVFIFKRKKRFHFDGLEPEPYIPVLISACAIQITFGLRKYRMPFFKDIFIFPDQYTYGVSTEVWAGHVNRKGIHLAWRHFMHGYDVHGDRYNVGLHEMAHALVYVNFLGTFFGRDRNFAEQFMDYKKKAEAMLPTLHQLPCNIFTSQASHNYHECWAESVELFFENPAELHENYPDLYNLIKELLNQDPVNGIKILKPVR